MQLRNISLQPVVYSIQAVVGSVQPCLYGTLTYRKGGGGMEISERLQQLRKLANYSQEQLADMLGVSRQAISKWESAQANPDINNIIKLSDIYNVSADYILMGKESNSDLNEVKCNIEKKAYNHISKKALSVIAIIGSTAIITILFIVALTSIAFFIRCRVM